MAARLADPSLRARAKWRKTVDGMRSRGRTNGAETLFRSVGKELRGIGFFSPSDKVLAKPWTLGSRDNPWPGGAMQLQGFCLEAFGTVIVGLFFMHSTQKIVALFR